MDEPIRLPDPDSVRDRESFLAFVEALVDDRRASLAAGGDASGPASGPEAHGWRNVTIEDFLEAALAWAEATDMGEGQGLPPGPSWRAFAAFLFCGKTYE